MKNICFYHDDSDGIMSAAIVMSVYPSIKCVPVQYGSEDKAIAQLGSNEYEHIFLVDFSFTEELMDKLIEHANIQFVWIDHHKSAMEKMPDLWNSTEIAGIREIGKSGCLLTWEYFHTTSAPMSVHYINDYDIWAHKLPDTKPFHEGFCLFYTRPERIDPRLLIDDDVSNVLEAGRYLIAAKNQRIEKVFKNGNEREYYGHKAYFVNCPHDISNLGHYILEQGYDIAVIFYDEGDKINYSLRSKPDVDVSEIAKSYGGGGHKNAAGYHIKR